MDSNPLLAALQSNYGDGTPPPPDTSTVRGLLAFCKLWLDGEVETGELNNPCMSMSGRLKAGAKDTEKDLRQNPDLVDSAREPIEKTAEAYWLIADVLDKLPQLAAENDVDAYREAIEIFEEERQIVLDANAEIERTLSGQVKLCPRCGEQGEDEVCQPCGLIRLYPDPRAAEFDRSKTAVLDPVYGHVYQAYVAVLAGDEPLPVIFDAVSHLEQTLIALEEWCRQVTEAEVPEDESTEDREGREVAERLLKEINRSKEGVERIRSTHESYQMSDLSRGWDAIFDAAVDMQRTTQRYAKSSGFTDMLAQESDGVDFGGS